MFQVTYTSMSFYFQGPKYISVFSSENSNKKILVYTILLLVNRKEILRSANLQDLFFNHWMLDVYLSTKRSHILNPFMTEADII